jgi:HEAT repeat protein
VGADYYIDLLSSSASRVDRFVAAKALRYFHFPSVLEALRKKLQDVREEKLVLYEVAASLLEINDVAGRNYIDDIISERDPHQIHEVVISLCDISPDKSFPVIKNVLENADLSKSVRATAAWALGELGLQEAFDVLVNTFNSLDTEIKREAARALFQIYRKHRRPLSNEILKEFKTTDSKRREGLSWVIGKMLRDELELYFQDVLNLVVDEDSKIWTSYILGVQDPINFADKRELIRMKDEKLFFAVNVLWVILRSWIWGLEEY